MNKTYKKSDIHKYIKENKNEDVMKEDDINELVDIDGSMIDKNDNYRATPSIVKSKKTSDDFVRSATQGPEAYFVYGGPYYGVNYHYVVNEEENVIEDSISDEVIQDLDAFHGGKKKFSRDPRERARKFADKEIKKHYYKPKPPGYDLDPSDEWASYSLPYDLDMDIFNDKIEEDLSESKMKELVDEMFLSKKDEKGIVKKMKEQDILSDKTSIPDVSELKKTYEKPLVVRKLNHLLDLIKKEQIEGEQLAIILNHLFDAIDINSIDDTYREILGDKIKYSDEE